MNSLKRNYDTFRILSGVLLLLCLLDPLLSLFRGSLSLFNLLILILIMVGLIVAALGMLIPRSRFLFPAGIGLLLLQKLISFFTIFSFMLEYPRIFISSSLSMVPLIFVLVLAIVMLLGKTGKAMIPLSIVACSLYVVYGLFFSSIAYLPFFLAQGAGMCFALLCLNVTEGELRAYGRTGSTMPYGYCHMAVHVLLMLFTFGIWSYIWIYRVSNCLNREENDRSRGPAGQLLLCMFVPFYYYFWVYRSAKRIDELSRRQGRNSDIATVCLILAFFVGIVPPILMQDKLNRILMAKAPAPDWQQKLQEDLRQAELQQAAQRQAEAQHQAAQHQTQASALSAQAEAALQGYFRLIPALFHCSRSKSAFLQAVMAGRGGPIREEYERICSRLSGAERDRLLSRSADFALSEAAYPDGIRLVWLQMPSCNAAKRCCHALIFASREEAVALYMITGESCDFNRLWRCTGTREMIQLEQAANTRDAVLNQVHSWAADPTALPPVLMTEKWDEDGYSQSIEDRSKKTVHIHRYDKDGKPLESVHGILR